MRKLLLALMLLLAAPAWAANYYIATTGDDGTGTGAIGAPWKTLGKASSVADDDDTVWVRAGTYEDFLSTVTHTVNSGSAGHVVTFRGYTGETAIIQPGATSAYALLVGATYSYLTFIDLIFDGTGASGGNLCDVAGDNLTFRNCTFRDCSDNSGLYISSASADISLVRCNGYSNGNDAADHGVYCSSDTGPVTIDGGEWHDNIGAGLQIGLSGSSATNTTITNVYSYDNGAWGIVTYRCDGAKVYNNVCTGNPIGIELYSYTINSFYYSNTVYDSTVGIQIADASCTGNTIKNNIIDTATTAYNDLSSDITNVESNNYWDTGDPLFTNPGTGDFTLQAASDCINAGAALGTPYNYDKTGKARPVGAGYDQGAYEYGTPVSPVSSGFMIIAETPISPDPLHTIRAWVNQGLVSGSWYADEKIFNISLGGKTK